MSSPQNTCHQWEYLCRDVPYWWPCDSPAIAGRGAPRCRSRGVSATSSPAVAHAGRMLYSSQTQALSTEKSVAMIATRARELLAELDRMANAQFESPEFRHLLSLPLTIP